MKFVSVRELRGQPGKVWSALRLSKELVITSNGKPIGILSPTNENKLEEDLAAMRRGKALQNLAAIHRKSVEQGTDRITDAEIDAEIDAVRRRRRN